MSGKEFKMATPTEETSIGVPSESIDTSTPIEGVGANMPSEGTDASVPTEETGTGVSSENDNGADTKPAATKRPGRKPGRKPSATKQPRAAKKPGRKPGRKDATDKQVADKTEPDDDKQTNVADVPVDTTNESANATSRMFGITIKPGDSEKSQVGGNWHNRDAWSPLADRMESKASMLFRAMEWNQKTETVITCLIQFVYLWTLPPVSRKMLTSSCVAMQELRNEAMEIIAEYGQCGVLYTSALPDDLKKQAIKVGENCYLVKPGAQVSMPLVEFIFYNEFLGDHDLKILEEWSGIPTNKIVDFMQCLFGYLQKANRMRHVADQPTAYVDINDNGSGMNFSFVGCHVTIRGR
jgi:hypothetical protein